LHRDFIDPENHYWQVWFVLPTAAKRGAAPVVVPPGYENGWLCFERDDGKKCRLVPVPESWETATVVQLWEWCRRAQPVVERA